MSIKSIQTVVAKNIAHLSSIISEAMSLLGPNCDLNFIDVSQVTNMCYLFFQTDFNGDISQWDVSNVTDMKYMFFGSKFNGDISNWDVSKVKDMTGMFSHSEFNGDISNWKLSFDAHIYQMFKNSKFNGDITSWTRLRKEVLRKDLSPAVEVCGLPESSLTMKLYRKQQRIEQIMLEGA